MIWKKIAEGRFESNGGSTREYPLASQSWGFQGKQIIYGLYIRSFTGAAKVGVRHAQGATPDSNAFVFLALDPIPAAPPSTSPTNLAGSVPEDALPHFQPWLKVDDGGAVESVDIELWAGTKDI